MVLLRGRGPMLRAFLIVLTFGLRGIAPAGAAEFWQPSNGPYGGIVNSLLVTSAGTVLAAAGPDCCNGLGRDGLFRSIDSGSTWSDTTVGLSGVRVNCLAEGQNGALYAGSYGSGVFESVDDGQSWTPINSSISSTVVDAIVVLGDGTILAATRGGGLKRSTDDGVSWSTPLPSTGSLTSLIVHPSGAIVVGALGGAYRSVDGGQSWAWVTDLAGQIIEDVALSATGELWAAALYGGAMRSLDAGASWTPVSGGLGASNGVFRVAGLANGSMIASTTSAGLMILTQGSASWSGLPHQPQRLTVYDVAELPSLSILAATDGGIFGASSIASPWSSSSTGLINSIVFDVAAMGPALLYAATTGGLWRSTDLGATWSRLADGLPASGDVTHIAILAPSVVVAVDGQGLFRSPDGNVGFVQMPGPDSSEITATLVSGIQLWVATEMGVYESDDFGSAWSQRDVGLPTGSVRVLAESGGFLYAGTANAGVFRSADRGGSWVPMNGGLSRTEVNDLAAAPDGTLFLSIWNRFYISSDLGSSWVENTSIPTSQWARRLLAPRDALLVAAHAGQGTTRVAPVQGTWQPVSDSFDELSVGQVRALAVNPAGEIFAGTNGNGVARSAVNVPEPAAGELYAASLLSLAWIRSRVRRPGRCRGDPSGILPVERIRALGLLWSPWSGSKRRPFSTQR